MQSGTGTTLITNNGTINATGFGISILPTSGPVTVAGTGSINSANVGVLVNSGAAPVSITTGAITTTGLQGTGVQVSNNGTTSITTGPIVTSGAQASGISATGINGAITINASDTRSAGANTNAAIAANQAAGAVGAITVTTGIVRGGTAGLNLSGGTNPNAIIVNATDTQSVFGAIQATTGGAINITSGTATSTGTGTTLTAITGVSSAGPVTVVAGNTQSSGGRAIFAQGRNDASVTSDTATAAAGSVAVIAQTASGAQAGTITVKSGTITSGGNGISAFGPRATVNVDSLAMTTGSITGNALEAYGLDVTVNSGTISTNASGINAGSANGGVRGANTVINSGTVTMNGLDANTSSGIFVQGENVTINSGTITASGTGNRVGINAIINTQTIGSNTGTLPGALTVNSGSITTVGNGAYGIRALGDLGLVTINSTGTITTVGGTRQVAANTFRYSDGITATSFNGSVAVTSNNVTTSGVEAVGIRVEAGSGVTQNDPAAAPVAGNVAVTSNGAISTSGANSAGILVRSGNGTATIANTGSIATTGAGSNGISVTAGTGATTVTSNVVTTQGDFTNAILVASTTGAIAINATSVTATGADAEGVVATSTSGAITVNTGTVTTGMDSAGVDVRSTDGAITITAANTIVNGAAAANGVAAPLGNNAIDGISTNGAVTINAGTATSANGSAINGAAGTTAQVTATNATANGANGSGVRVVGGTAVSLTVGSATSVGASTGAAADGRSDAIFAEALTGAITANVGSASATGAASDGIRLVANGAGGAVTLGVTGNVSSASGYGIFIDPPGNVNVSVAAGATVSGALAGLDTVSDTGVNTLVNAGTIRSTGGAAIIAGGTTTLDNRGTLSGTGGTAVQLGASNDTVTLRTGSVVTGAIVGGGGTDAAVLIGAGTAPVATQTVATFQGFDNLTVQSGYWTAPTTAGTTVARTTIASGAALELANGTTGVGYVSPAIVDNGALVVRTTAGTSPSILAGTTVSGSGTTLFTGAGTATFGGTTSFTNTGLNTVDVGSAVQVNGTVNGNFVNNGTFTIGTGGTTGTFAGNFVDNGTLIINRSDTYNFTGALSGAGTFVKQGAGTVVFGTNYAFTGTTQLNGGTIRLSTPVAANTELDVRGSGTVDLSGQTNTVAELMGNSATASVNIAGGALTVNQATNTTFAGALTGAGGAFTKSGTGTLNLTGVNTYTGPTTINGGTLAVNGSIASSVTVNAGGTLGGAGTINGSVTIGAGGVFSPGNSPGTITVANNVNFLASSTYLVEVNAAGVSDRIVASGTAALNGTVAVNAAAGTYGQLTNYTILTAAGGVSGRFANVTSNMAFLSPILGYSANAVTLTLARNDVSFQSMTNTSNQSSVAVAIAGRSFGDPVFNAILFAPAASIAAGFDQLSGEVHATVPSVLVDGGRRVRGAVLDRGALDTTGVGVWIDGVQSFARSKGQAPLAQARTNRTGAFGGIDYASNGVKFGVNGGYFDQQIRVPGRASSASVDTTLVGASIAYVPSAGQFSAQAGLTHAWHDVDTARATTFTGLAGSFTSASDARSTEAFGEVAYALKSGTVAVSPFLRYTHDWTKADGFAEAGVGAAALTLRTDRRSVNFGTAGVRVGGHTDLSGVRIEPKLTLSYERAWGDRSDTRTAAFSTGTGPSFGVTGVRLGRDTFDANIGADAVLASGFRIGVGGFASTSDEWRDYGGKITAGIRF